MIPQSLQRENVVRGFLANGIVAYDAEGRQIPISEAHTMSTDAIFTVMAVPVAGYGDKSICFMDTADHEPGLPDVPETRLAALLYDMGNTVTYMQQKNGNACFMGVNYSLQSMMWKAHPLFSDLNGGQTVPYFHPSVYTFDDPRFSNHSLQGARNSFLQNHQHAQTIAALNAIVTQDVVEHSSFDREDLCGDAMGFTYRVPSTIADLLTIDGARKTIGRLSLDVYSALNRLNLRLYGRDLKEAVEYTLQCAKNPNVQCEEIAQEMNRLYSPTNDWLREWGGTEAGILRETGLWVPGGSWSMTMRVPAPYADDQRPEVAVTYSFSKSPSIGHVEGGGIHLQKAGQLTEARREKLQKYYEEFQQYLVC